jgi:hypothetical protein
MLMSLMYYSNITPGIKPDEVANIFRTAQRRNSDRGISGVLYSDGKRFLQVIEGSRREVSQVFATIQKDPRHQDITVASCSEIAEREFDEWSMGLMKRDSAVKAILKEQTGSEYFDPQSMDSRQLMGLIRRLADERLRHIVPHFRAPAASGKSFGFASHAV